MTTAADFGTKIMSIKATDRDDGLNGTISYYQIGDIHRTLAEGLEQLTRPAFLVDRRSGGVLLNFDPQKGMKGYFDFMVRRFTIYGVRSVNFNRYNHSRFLLTTPTDYKMSLMFSFTYYGKINESDLFYDSSRLKFGITFIYSESEYTPRFNVGIIFFCIRSPCSVILCN